MLKIEVHSLRFFLNGINHFQLQKAKERKHHRPSIAAREGSLMGY